MGEESTSGEDGDFEALITRSKVEVSRRSPRRAALLLVGSAVAIGALAVGTITVGVPLVDRLVPVEVRAVYQSPSMYLAQVIEHAVTLHGVRAAEGEHLGGDGFLDPAELEMRIEIDPTRTSLDDVATELAEWIDGYPPTSGVYIIVMLSDGQSRLQQRHP